MQLLDSFHGRSRVEIHEELLSLGIEAEVVQEFGSNLPHILRHASDPSAFTTKEFGNL